MSVSTVLSSASSPPTPLPSVGTQSFTSSSITSYTQPPVPVPGVQEPSEPPVVVTLPGSVEFKSPSPANRTPVAPPQDPTPASSPSDIPPPPPANPAPNPTESNPAPNNYPTPGRSASGSVTLPISRTTGSTSSRPNTVGASSTSTGVGVKRKGPTTKKMVLVVMAIGAVLVEVIMG